MTELLASVSKHRRTVVAAFLLAFIFVLLAPMLPGMSSHIVQGEAISRPAGCCLRAGVDADLASAEFQQALATAIVQSGAELQNFSAPRPSVNRGFGRLTAIVTFSGSEESIVQALGAVGVLRPEVAIASADLDRGESGAPLTARVYLVQWVRVSQGY